MKITGQQLSICILIQRRNPKRNTAAIHEYLSLDLRHETTNVIIGGIMY